MPDGVSVLAFLMLISAMIAVILAIIWATMGRARHAATWAIAFGLAAVEWAATLGLSLGGSSAPGDTVVMAVQMLISALALAVVALLARGFFQRSRPGGRHRWPLLAAGVLLAVIVAGMLLWSHMGLRRATTHLFAAVLLLLSSREVVARGIRPTPAEHCVIAMLWLFALFATVAGVLSLASGADGMAAGGLDRDVVILGLPTAFVSLGLCSVFLLAADLAERMRQLAARDPLTGVLNRRGFDEAAEGAIANALRHDLPLSIALADIDRFKAVNDLHGHAAGDRLLRRFADAMNDSIRQGDLFGRLGGEEFVLLLVNTRGDAAVTVIDRLRRDVATLTLATAPPLTVTTSFGVAELRAGDTLESLVERADQALYRSKADGRDRVSFVAADDWVAA